MNHPDVTHANVLVFSGLDPTGGAGLQADIETISCLGATPCSIITAVTAQDTHSVHAYQNIDSQFIKQQASYILNDIPIECIKLGMIADVDIINEIASIIKNYPEIPLVIDPIMTAGGGGDLTNSKAFDALRSRLIPKATIITPNSLEARLLVLDSDKLAECAQQLLNTGCQAVLITGSHEASTDVNNTLYLNDETIHHSWPRLADNFHGSGCTLSSSIAAYLALGHTIKSAVSKAQQYTYNTLLNAKKIGCGQLLPNRYYAQDSVGP